MKLAIIMAAIMALASPVASIQAGGRPLDVCKSGPASWIQECEGCGGDPGCLECINDVRSRSGNLGLARQCATCIHTANPGPCYKCITDLRFHDDSVQRAEECELCANQGPIRDEICSSCVAYMPTLSHAQECKFCRGSRCFSCHISMLASGRLSSLYGCKTLP